MIRISLASLACLLALSASAHAGTQLLSIDRAQHAIESQYVAVTLAKPRYVEVVRCRRTSARRIACWVREQMNGPACFSEEKWVAQLSRDGKRVSVLAGVTGSSFAYGDCASVQIAPVIGQPSTG